MFVAIDLCKRGGTACMMAPRTAAGVGAVAFEEIERLQVNDMPWTEVNSGLPHQVFLKTLNRDRETRANLMLVHETSHPAFAAAAVAGRTICRWTSKPTSSPEK